MMTTATGGTTRNAAVRSAIGAALLIGLSSLPALAGTPQIRTSSGNAVPQCVTPQRLMAFLKDRNPRIEPRFAHIAASYKRHGETWRVRWDYAFFQMAVETNFLSFRRGDGSKGDVNPSQNNFAGLGTTGGGVPGDSYPDVDTGVLAQIQHLVVYSGEHIADPVGHRTRLKQDVILKATAQFKGHTTFADLSRRWAADRHYGAAIEWVAGKYRAAYCRTAEAPTKQAVRVASAETFPPASALGGPQAKIAKTNAPPVRTIWSRSGATEPEATGTAATKPQPKPVATPAMPERARATTASEAPKPGEHAADKKPVVVPAPVEVTQAPRLAKQAPPPQPVSAEAHSGEEPQAFAFAASMVAAEQTAPVQQAEHCRVFSASYGGTKTLLIKAESEGELHYTTLTVLDGSEDSMLADYLKAHAPNGSSLGTFPTRDAALMKAGELCPAPADALNDKSASAG